MSRALMIALALAAIGCNKDKAADTTGDVALTVKSLGDVSGPSTDPAWSRPSGRRFVSLRADILMNTCDKPTLKSSDAALVDPGYGRVAAAGGAFGDAKAAPGTLADLELKPCTDGKTTTPAEFVFLVPDNMDVTAASFSFRAATTSLAGMKK